MERARLQTPRKEMAPGFGASKTAAGEGEEIQDDAGSRCDPFADASNRAPTQQTTQAADTERSFQ